MISLVAALLLLIYLPYRLSRGFPMPARIAILFVVAVKTVIIIFLHLSLVRETGIPVVIDESVDAKDYYDFAMAFDTMPWTQITRDDIIAERGASSHLGYYVINLIALKLCHIDPMLFLRLCKLLLFHVALGMLATTWRLKMSANRAFVAYMVLGLLFYQFFYYNFRDLKDDVVLSIFMMIMAIADRMLLSAGEPASHSSKSRALLRWTSVAFLTWAVSTIRFYIGLAIACGFAMHAVTGRGMKIAYRVVFAVVIAGGFLFLTTRSGFTAVEDEGGASALTSAAGNIYGLFKVFVSPLPWQHSRPILAVPHTLYLLLMPVALWGFFARLRSNFDWKLYIVILVALTVGGHLQDYEPRKRYVMYPIFASWIVMAGRRRRASEDSEISLDANAYFATRPHAYT